MQILVLARSCLDVRTCPDVRGFQYRLGDVELSTVMVIGLDTSRISRLDVEMSVYTVKIKIERKGKTRRPDT